ncbi:MAG: putative methyl-accepting chemotaxis protein YoaH [Clostridium sp.]|jgi:methyl-accepting chemotaxis protein
MIKVKNSSFATKILTFSISNVVVASIILICFGYFLQSDILLDSLRNQTSQITQSWSEELKTEDVEKAKEAKDYSDPAEKQLTEYFDLLSKYNPVVAQGYIFGTELQDGNKTSIIAMPSHVIKDFQDAGLKLGDMYEQPNEIANAIKSMLESGKVTFTNVYKDDYGTWMTILYPIQDKNGEISSYFGIDVDASIIPNGQRKLIVSSLIMLAIFLVLAIFIQFIFIKKSTSPINELVKGIDKVSHGNFDVELKTGSDELGIVNSKFNIMVQQVREMISKVKKASSDIDEFCKKLLSITEENNEHTVKITKDIREMAASIETQEQSTVESAKAMNEIASGIQTIANNVSNVSSSAANMENKSAQGNDAVQKVVKQIKLISNAVESTARVVKTLDERSKEISNIMNVITDISEKTNLLALNAAIESARAGEHGKGFAVVADEVRKLAEQSKSSAGEIVQLIQVIQSEVTNAVSSMNTGTKEVTVGMEIAKQTGDLFLEILNTTKEVASQIQDASDSSQQISATTEEVSAAVTDLMSIARQTSSTSNSIANNVGLQQASLESIVDSSKQLSLMSEELQKLISNFQV